MRLEVILFGPHAKLLPPGSEGGRTVVELEGPATVDQVLDHLGVPETGRTYVTVNGRRVEPATPVGDGDEVRVIVPLGGG
ncbi:MAG TPA: MoaD/ThiS family protein [Thermoleophilia bacterium]|jgi:sulfur carrier protein ThiS